jgi:hypothetical protein
MKFSDIYTYQTGLSVLHNYLKINELNYLDFEEFNTEYSMLKITNDFLFCITEKDINKVIKKYNLYKWYLNNDIDLYIIDILDFISILKSHIVPECAFLY